MGYMCANVVFDIGNGLLVANHPGTGVLVRSDGAVFWHKSKSNTYRWTFGCKNSNECMRVGINGKNYDIHRLVAETFIPNPENKPVVDHYYIRNRTVNAVWNLRWATVKENNNNSSQVYNAYNYGVRSCDDRKEYMKRSNHRLYEIHKQDDDWVASKRERNRLACKKYHDKKRQDPAYLEMKRIKAREAYYAKKGQPHG